jgi:hypothetical protein
MGATGFLGLIDGGASLVVGTVSGDGQPRAGRAWASRIVEREPLRIRLVMALDDEVTVENVAPGAIVAVTGADVRTLQSVQLKGCVRVVEPPAADDLTLAAEHSQRFIDAVIAVDGLSPDLLRRMLPYEVVCVELEIDDRFDQSPGPAAGRPWEDRR